MSDLIVNNHVIKAPISDILNKIKSQLTNGKLRTIGKVKNDHIMVTCPEHSDGREEHPSCGIYVGDSPDIEYGKYHCFTCNSGGPLWHFIALCFDESDAFGKKWLIDNFGGDSLGSDIYFPSFDLDELKPVKESYLDESILDKFQPWHPYMDKRKLSRKVCEKFKVKYDKKSECLVFPVWNESGKLYMLTRRSVNNKTFIIDANKEKPVYLLNFIKDMNIKEITICESQINTLTLWSWGIPSVATFGCNVTKKQLEIINKSGVNHIYLCYDGDDAGKKGTLKFINNISKSIFVDVIIMTKGKDVNDLTVEEFDKLPIMSAADWKVKYAK